MSSSVCGARVEWNEGQEEVGARLAWACPSDVVRGLLFLGTFDEVRTRVGEAAARRCVEVGGEPRVVEFFNYPVGSFLRVNETAARELAPVCGGWEEAQRWLGRRAAVDMLGLASGKALRLLSRGDVRRLVGVLPTAYRSSLNYGERQVVWEGPSRGRILMRRDFLPVAWHEGLLRAALEDLRARRVEVRGIRLGPLEGEYTLSWE